MKFRLYLHRILAKDLVQEMFAGTGLCRLGSHLHAAALALRFQVDTWDILVIGTSATQRQKFHSDCIDGCLHYNPVVLGFQICAIFHFSC